MDASPPHSTKNSTATFKLPLERMNFGRPSTIAEQPPLNSICCPNSIGFEVEEEKGRNSRKIENEISLLNSRLELEKAAERLGRVAAAKFMQPPAKQSVKNSDAFCILLPVLLN